MTEHEQSILLQAPRDTIFDVLMDLANLPRLVPIVQNTTAEPGDRVRIQGSVQGHHYLADGARPRRGRAPSARVGLRWRRQLQRVGPGGWRR